MKRDSMYEQAEWVLAWWELGALRDHEVIAWAEGWLGGPGGDYPEWLITLATEGPQSYAASSFGGDAPVARLLSFREAAAARAEATNPEDRDQVLAFMRWVTRAALGEDTRDPVVEAAYQIDHLNDDLGLEEEALEATRILVRSQHEAGRPMRALFH